MKIAVINFSGNGGKSTIARHLLQPRINGADLVTFESLNADEGHAQTIRGRQFADLQEYLQTVDSAVVDIGASDVEELLDLMRQYRGSHEDFDLVIVSTAPAFKQQQDTIATLVELSRIGVPPSRIRLLFNRIDEGPELARSFQPLLSFLSAHPLARADTACRMGKSETYAPHLKVGLPKVAEVASVKPSSASQNSWCNFRLLPSEPPGRCTRKALAFAHEIRRLHVAGYTLEAIRKALSEAGVLVSRSTVHREATRPAESACSPAASKPAENDAAAIPSPSPSELFNTAVINAAPMSMSADGQSGKDITEAFMATQTTNRFIRAKEQP